MAITKTKFINYIRCPRYVALDNLKKEKLDSIVTYEEYKKEESEEKLVELLDSMYDGEVDLIDIKDEHLEMMMPYYNEVEILAGHLAPKYFKGKFKFSRDTKNQESFDAIINNIRYICYVDIYNEDENKLNIIECKATTTKKYLGLGYKGNSIFKKDTNGIYRLLEDLNENIEDYMPKEKYENEKAQLFDKYSTQIHFYSNNMYFEFSLMFDMV